MDDLYAPRDHGPGVLVGVRVVVTDPAGGMIAEVEHVPNVAEDFVSGVRVAELSIEAESVRLEGSLVGLSGSEFITRRVLTQLGSGNTGVTILITRDCVDVECSDSAAPACLGTQCVPEECSPENPELCGDGVCVVDADCESAVGCATGTCETGACVFRGDDESCGGGEFCHPEAGCQPSGPEDWWDSAWRRRLKLTFRNATRAENLVDFKGLNARSPWFALMMMFFMLSMAGIPPLIGFFGKLNAISAVLGSGYTGLAVLMMLASVVGLFYYLKVVWYMYFEEAEDQTVLQAKPDARLVMSLNGIAVLALGIVPGWLWALCLAVLS